MMVQDQDNGLREALHEAGGQIDVPSAEALIARSIVRGRRVMKRRRAVVTGAGAVGVLAVAGVVAVVTVPSGEQAVGPAGSATTSSSPAPTPSDLASLLASKSAVASAERSTHQAAPDPTAGLVPGIIATKDVPLSTMDFRATTRWTGKVGGTWYRVWAGRSGTAPTAGELVIMSTGAGGKDGSVLLPGSGTLRITSARAQTLTCTDASGRTHVFDLLTGTWQ